MQPYPSMKTITSGFFFFGEKGHRGCRSSSTFLYHNNLRFWRDVIGYKTKELIAYGDTGG